MTEEAFSFKKDEPTIHMDAHGAVNHLFKVIMLQTHQLFLTWPGVDQR